MAEGTAAADRLTMAAATGKLPVGHEKRKCADEAEAENRVVKARVREPPVFFSATFVASILFGLLQGKGKLFGFCGNEDVDWGYVGLVWTGQPPLGNRPVSLVEYLVSRLDSPLEDAVLKTLMVNLRCWMQSSDANKATIRQALQDKDDRGLMWQAIRRAVHVRNCDCCYVKPNTLPLPQDQVDAILSVASLLPGHCLIRMMNDATARDQATFVQALLDNGRDLMESIHGIPLVFSFSCSAVMALLCVRGFAGVDCFAVTTCCDVTTGWMDFMECPKMHAKCRPQWMSKYHNDVYKQVAQGASLLRDFQNHWLVHARATLYEAIQVDDLSDLVLQFIDGSGKPFDALTEEDQADSSDSAPAASETMQELEYMLGRPLTEEDLPAWSLKPSARH